MWGGVETAGGSSHPSTIFRREISHIYKTSGKVLGSYISRYCYRLMTYTGDKKGVYWVLVWKPEGKRPLRTRRRRQEDIKIDIEDVGWGGVDRIDLAQDRYMWRAVCEWGNGLPGCIKCGGVSWPAEVLLASQERLLLDIVSYCKLDCSLCSWSVVEVKVCCFNSRRQISGLTPHPYRSFKSNFMEHHVDMAGGRSIPTSRLLAHVQESICPAPIFRFLPLPQSRRQRVSSMRVTVVGIWRRTVWYNILPPPTQ